MNQDFKVIYQNEFFVVDPSLLYDASQKFKDLLSQNGLNYVYMHNINLKIMYNGFTSRNVSNFLKLCQNQPTDIQNSEMKEICLIAKLFQADKILTTGLNFILKNMDNKFYIPNDKFKESNGNRYLILESEDSDIPIIYHYQLENIDYYIKSDESTNETLENKDNNLKKKNTRPVTYQIATYTPFMKRSRYYLLKNGKVLYMAKQTDYEIYIGEGEHFHLKDKKIKNIAKIIRDCCGYNIVKTKNQEFKIKFWKFDNKYSVSATFQNKGKNISWRPRNQTSTKSDEIESKKNINLQNQKNEKTYNMRKTSKKDYEIEFNPDIDPIIAFTIAISEITGPISPY